MDGRIFEIGNRFFPKALPITEYPYEKKTLCVGVFGKEESFFTLKGIAEKVADTFCLTFKFKEITLHLAIIFMKSVMIKMPEIY